MSELFTPTARQIEALRKFKKDRRDTSKDIIRTAYYGGSRSGKTRLICEQIHTLCMKYPGGWYLIARKHANHAIMSIWLDTLAKVIAPDRAAITDINNTKYYIRYANGSMIFVDGLDHADRVEKILGREYIGIFLNEVSQIAYPTIEVLMSRLAQKIDGLKPMIWQDFNPPAKSHWTYRLFIEHREPKTKKPIPEKDRYTVCKMNPVDNLENIAAGYIESILQNMSENSRQRFEYGNFQSPEGVIFQNIEIIESIPDDIKEHAEKSIGIDFGFTIDPAVAEELYYYDRTLYINEIVYATGLRNTDLIECLKSYGVGIYDDIAADCAEPKSITDLQDHFFCAKGAAKGSDSVKHGIDWLLSLKKIYITAKSVYTTDDFNNYSWKTASDGQTLPVPEEKNDHAPDATRYGCEKWQGEAGEPSVIIIEQ